MRVTILENPTLFFGESFDWLTIRTSYDGIDYYKLHLRLYGCRRVAVMVPRSMVHPRFCVRAIPKCSGATDQSPGAIASTAMRFMDKSMVPMIFTLWFTK